MREACDRLGNVGKPIPRLQRSRVDSTMLCGDLSLIFGTALLLKESR